MPMSRSANMPIWCVVPLPALNSSVVVILISAIDCREHTGLDHPCDIGGKIECRTRLKRRRSGLTKCLARNETAQKDCPAGREVPDNDLESWSGYQRILRRDRHDRIPRALTSVRHENRHSRK